MVRYAWVDMPCREINLILHNRYTRTEGTLLKVMTNWLDGQDLGFDGVDGIWVAARRQAIHTIGKYCPNTRQHSIQADKEDRRKDGEHMHSRLTVVVFAWVRVVDVFIH